MFLQQMNNKILCATDGIMAMLNRRDAFLMEMPENFIRNAAEWRYRDSDATVSVEEVEYLYRRIAVDAAVFLEVFRRFEEECMSIAEGGYSPNVMRSQMLGSLHRLADNLGDGLYLLRKMHNEIGWMQATPEAPGTLRGFVCGIAECKERYHDTLQYVREMIEYFSKPIESPPQL